MNALTVDTVVQDCWATSTETVSGEARFRSMAGLEPIRAELLSRLESNGFTEKDRFAVRLCLEEAVSNAIRHGNQSLPEKYATVHWSIHDEEVVITVEDEGDGFDENSVPDPTLPENINRASGRGLLIMRYYMNEVRYDRNGSRVSMRRRRSGTSSRSARSSR